MNHLTVDKFVAASFDSFHDGRSVSTQAPSNIALVKYWGKYDNQIPANPSISFTLSKCATTTNVKYSLLEKTSTAVSFEFLFEGNPKPSFEPKLKDYFNRISAYVPFLNQYHLRIDSKNTFPHSSGIASSASAMAALSLCLLEIEKSLNPSISKTYYNQKASFLARLGSGSACRSIEGPIVSWGKHREIKQSSDLFGTPFEENVHEVFQDYRDTILLVHKGQKQVSSTVGHKLMDNHPYASSRFDHAHQNLSEIIQVLTSGDLKRFIEIVENEALTLHAMMMTSIPYFILMKPNTLAIIERIWRFRGETETPLCFTLDAGANVHLLYPSKSEKKVLQFIKNELVVYCENGQYICDQVGTGAKLI